MNTLLSEMDQRSRTPLIPSSMLNRFKQAGREENATVRREPDAVAKHHSILLRQNKALAKENAVLKQRLRSLTDRRLHLEAAQVNRNIPVAQNESATESMRKVEKEFLEEFQMKLSLTGEAITKAQEHLLRRMDNNKGDGPVVEKQSKSTPRPKQKDTEPELEAVKSGPRQLEKMFPRTVDSKENVDPALFAPKKKQESRTSNLRIRKFMKRNAWGLAFEPITPALKRSQTETKQTVDLSVYDFK